MIVDHPIYHRPSVDDEQCFEPADVFQAGINNHHISNTAYPIQHHTTWNPYRVVKSKIQDAVVQTWKNNPEILLYAHIPFCESRCYYCEYTVVSQKEKHSHDEYMNRLLQEIQLYSTIVQNKPAIRGFDIGGGTPSIISADWIDRLVNKARTCFSIQDDLEISIETTPSIAANDPDKIRSCISSGIKRISMGVQVTQPDLLRILNRSNDGLVHHQKAVENIRRAGFKKFNIDLMYGFANQSLDGWQQTLNHTIQLAPDFITLYRMRYKLTRISHQAHLVTLEMISKLKKLACELLESAGYHARPGKNTFSKIAGDPGTSDYLTQRVVHATPYIGLGLGAQSFSTTSIAYNKGSAGKNLKPYIKAVDKGELPIQDYYDLSREQLQAKMVAVSFYFGEIHLPSFKKRFGLGFVDAYPAEVDFVLQNGYMFYDEENLSLTKKGAEFYNGIIALFYAPSVKACLAQPLQRTSHNFVIKNTAYK